MSIRGETMTDSVAVVRLPGCRSVQVARGSPSLPPERWKSAGGRMVYGRTLVAAPSCAARSASTGNGESMFPSGSVVGAGGAVTGCGGVGREGTAAGPGGAGGAEGVARPAGGRRFDGNGLA